MHYHALSIICIVALSSCNEIAPEIPATSTVSLPTAIEARENDKLAESAGEFILSRYEALHEAVAKFGEWANRRLEGDNAVDLYEYGAVLLEEFHRPTADIVEDFIMSPKGAYLSEQDKEYLNRLLLQQQEEHEDFLVSIEKTIEDQLDARDRDIEKDEVWQAFRTRINPDLYGMFGTVHVIKRHLASLDQEDLNLIIASLRRRFHDEQYWLMFANQMAPQPEGPAFDAYQRQYDDDASIRAAIAERASLDDRHLECEVVAEFFGPLFLEAFADDRPPFTTDHDASMRLIRVMGLESYFGRELIDSLALLVQNAVAIAMTKPWRDIEHDKEIPGGYSTDEIGGPVDNS